MTDGRAIPAYAPEYSGSANNVEAPAVSDQHVIAASGLAAVDFARAIFAELGVFTEQNEMPWFEMFRHGRSRRAS